MVRTAFVWTNSLVQQAQGLLKSAISTGQSKEARLAKVRKIMSYMAEWGCHCLRYYQHCFLFFFVIFTPY